MACHIKNLLGFLKKCILDISWKSLENWLGCICRHPVVTKSWCSNWKISCMLFPAENLEKASDRVRREVISWAMRKLGVEEWRKMIKDVR